MAYEPKEIQDWKQELNSYTLNKKTAKPELYKSPNFTQPKTHFDVKQKEYAFDPILNRYRCQESDQKYLKSSLAKPIKCQLGVKLDAYDIITLDKAPPAEKPKCKSYSVDNHFQPYNIITNAITLPNHKAFRVRMKKINEVVFRDYNIINNEYWKNNSEKSQKDWDQKKQVLEKKYVQTHDFDPIRCNYYDEKKEDNFWIKEKEIIGKAQEMKNNQLPKSYKFREPINLNHENNTYITEGFEAFKFKEKSKLKRYKKRYEVENHFRELGNLIDDKSDNMKMNKFYAQRFLEEYKDGFDPITLEPATAINGTLKFALGNKRELIREKPRPKKKFRFLY